MPPQAPLSVEDQKIQKLLNEKKSARDFQVRKHEDWNDNYELYRNRVKTNRLTQRQTVNVPLMKETIKTLLSKVDDPPSVEWNERGGDEMKSLVYQAKWEKHYRDEEIEVKDVVDKKNVYLYGLSTKMLNLKKDGVSLSILDPFDVLYDPLTNPVDVETARFIVRQNIFKSLREILVDDRYNAKGKEELKMWLASDKGIVQSGKNKEEWEKRMERMRAMGVQNEKFPVYAGGDVVVNLTEHYTNLWNTSKKKFERHVVVYAEDTIELMDELLVDLIGMEEWPFDFWCEDPETNDVYPDGIADLVRTPNKLLNIWFSQQVENRTIQNFQMHWYDATVQGYTPQQYEPGPGRMLPAPGDPTKTIMPVSINGLDETFTAMKFVTQLVERATGATAIEKGEPEGGTQTLGEVEILVGKAGERAKTMSKFYQNAWYRYCRKWDKLMQNNKFPKDKLYRTGTNGKVYEKVVYDSDWKSEAGYEPTVASSSEQESDQIRNIQKFQFVINQFPENAALRSILQSRELKMLDLTPAELRQIQAEQKEKEELMAQQAMAAKAAEAAGPAKTPMGDAAGPAAMESPADLTPQIAELASLVS